MSNSFTTFKIHEDQTFKVWVDSYNKLIDQMTFALPGDGSSAIFIPSTTAHIAEDSSNLYYTDQRVLDLIQGESVNLSFSGNVEVTSLAISGYNNGSLVIDADGKWVGDPANLIGPTPLHQWSGTSLRFQQQDGSWGFYKNLKGDKGDAASVSVHSTVTVAAGGNASVTDMGTTPGNVELRFGIPQGVKGDAATISVGTVTTGAPGTSVHVTNSGSSSAAVFDFAIPRGAKGDKGDKPNHGWSGTSLRFENVNGTWGSYVNLKGDKGDPGSDGIDGIDGLKGDKPAHNWSGTSLRFENPNGTMGSYVNLRGPTGLKGDKPAHNWSGTSLRFENPNGTMGSYVDLKGEKGDPGDNVTMIYPSAGLVRSSGSGWNTSISLGSSTTTYLRNNGTWGTPPDTKYSIISTTDVSDSSHTSPGRLITGSRLNYALSNFKPSNAGYADDSGKLNGIHASGFLRNNIRNSVSVGSHTSVPILNLHGSTDAGSGSVVLSGYLHTYNYSSRYFLRFQNRSGLKHSFDAAGGSWQSGSAHAHDFTSDSDRNLKKDIKNLDTKDCLDIVSILEPKSFVWKETGKEDHGLIAQEVFEVAPHFAEDQKSVSYGKLTTYLIGAVQKQSEYIKQLEIKTATLELKLEMLVSLIKEN